MKYKADKKTKKVLLKLSKFVKAVDSSFFYTVMGGISIDGYYGKLTRNHHDVDFLIFREDLEKAEAILDKLGYKHKRFTHPDDSNLEYKMQTGNENHIFSFQVIDRVGKNDFEISFYRDLQMKFPISLIRPASWLKLEGVKFPAVSKILLLKLKKNEAKFYENLKKEDLEKYLSKRKDNHTKNLHDIELLRAT